jgi:hypothetical protein
VTARERKMEWRNENDTSPVPTAAAAPAADPSGRKATARETINAVKIQR